MMKINKFKDLAKLARLHQPTGIFLLLWPCLISLALAGKGNVDLKLAIVFIVGSILMRSAGCILNDIIDVKFDIQVERTKERALASGKISKIEATWLLILLLLFSSSLLFFLNKIAIIISLLSIALVIIYPFLKRFTYWPQLFLGFTFNIGALVAWAAARGNISSPATILYISLIFWTLGYDTIYAHQDKQDDLLIGVKSTAIKFGKKTAKYINWFYTITSILFIFAGSTAGVPYYFFCFAVAPIALLFWQVKTLDIDNKSNCARRFKCNTIVGLLMFLSIISTKLVS